ncbi:MAG: SDR family oxidoreductase [Anaerolineaceae bacterium]|nr:SDR family oxidoreductase [Anaerolineaceae bacterium]MBN2676573.1 SDR family oxidoreductase [Anaerolineaceae bacterium]
MKKVLLVGGAGYLGSILVDELLTRGYAVRVLDRLFFGDSGIEANKDRIELIVTDMRDTSEEVFEDVSIVINVGGFSNDPTAEFNPQANFEMNATATRLLAESCIKYGIKRFLFASSCSIYDLGVNPKSGDIVQDETTEVSPKASYALSKFTGERHLLEMTNDKFCPVILRMGTLFGFSPRMRYDLVVNTFVKDAISKGVMTMHYGGEMWRPLVDVHDAARAFISLIEADEKLVKGQIFNLVYKNLRISELALRVQNALAQAGVKAELHADYSYSGVRSYRVSGEKLCNTTGFQPIISIEESVTDMVEKLKDPKYSDYEHPMFYNIKWVKLLDEMNRILTYTGRLFN